MILPRWTAMRLAFAWLNVTDVDGLPVWPAAKLRINGFDNTVTTSAPTLAFPLTLTCNGGLTDAADGTSYNWYLSQRTDDETKQALLLSQLDTTKSGTVTLLVVAGPANARKLIPSGSFTTDDAVSILFNRASLYVQRASDKAIQRVDLVPYLQGI